MPFDELAAIESFWQARRRGEYFPREWFDRLNLDEVYRIQLGLIGRRVAAGERQIGWKVGLTAKAIQEQFGFHEPVFGCVLETFFGSYASINSFTCLTMKDVNGGRSFTWPPRIGLRPLI